MKLTSFLKIRIALGVAALLFIFFSWGQHLLLTLGIVLFTVVLDYVTVLRIEKRDKDKTGRYSTIPKSVVIVSVIIIAALIALVMIDGVSIERYLHNLK